MDPTKLSEYEFLGGTNLKTVEFANAIPTSDMARLLLEELGLSTFSSLPVIRQCGDFAVIRLGSLDTGLLDKNGTLVGYYVGNGLLIEGTAVGKGLSVPLILAALPNRPVPSERNVTNEGEAALRKAWRVANAGAVVTA
jgi:hypothetical protein